MSCKEYVDRAEDYGEWCRKTGEGTCCMGDEKLCEVRKHDGIGEAIRLGWGCGDNHPAITRHYALGREWKVKNV